MTSCYFGAFFNPPPFGGGGGGWIYTDDIHGRDLGFNVLAIGY